MLKYCSLFLLCAGLGHAADFMTGQAARLVIGQQTFTSQISGVSDTVFGAVGGLAYANGSLFVSEGNRLGLMPANNRVLIFNNVLQSFPAPSAPIDPGVGRCPVCGGQANVVVGQPDFVSSAQGLTAAGMRLPCAVSTDGQILAVADTANNRVLIWKSIPTAIGQPADLVLGQKDFNSIGPVVVDNKSFRAPQGVWIQNGKVFVADTQNNRVMIWNSIPTQNDQPADLVLGVPNFTSQPQIDLTKQTLVAAANSLLSPISVTSDGTHLFVADLGSNRVLIWNSIPTAMQQPADVEVGQVDFTGSNANDSTNLCPSSGVDSSGNPTYPDLCGSTMNFPRYALSDGHRLFIADSGNDRVLVYNSIPTQNAAHADIVLGQTDEFSSIVTSNSSLFDPLLVQSAANAIPTPTSLAYDGLNLFVADPSDYRILVFTPGTPNVPANGVVNSASRAIYAVATVTISGTITANDTVTLTINSTAYKYTILSTDTIDTIVQGLANVINAGSGDSNVLARSGGAGTGVLILTARAAGAAGNSITLAQATSTNATIVPTVSGGTLSGGQDAATLAPGALVTINGANLSDSSAAADPTAPQLPYQLANTQVYFDGIRAPLLYVSATQINAQLPFLVAGSNSVSAVVRVQHSDGSVTVANAIALPVSPQDPGVFADNGADPRPAVAVHASSYANGVISVDGSIAAGDIATVSVAGRVYSYTVVATDTLTSVRDALVALINADPEVPAVASGSAAFSRIFVRAKVPGPEGNGIPLSGSSSTNAVVTITALTANTCCANIAGARITPDNPAVPGETIIVYATGLGLVQPDAATAAIVDGAPYTGPDFNTANTFVSAQVGGSTANVLSAGLKVGTIGIYQIVMQLDPNIPTNPQTQVGIFQDIYSANITTIPVFNSN